jgi:hypothetical protein
VAAAEDELQTDEQSNLQDCVWLRTFIFFNHSCCRIIRLVVLYVALAVFNDCFDCCCCQHKKQSKGGPIGFER